MITKRGLKLLIVLLISSFLSVLTPSLGIVPITIVTVFLIDYITLLRKKVTGFKVKVKATAGERVSVEVPPVGEFVNDHFLKFENKGGKIEAVLNTRYFGNYVFKPKVVLKSFLGLFASVKESGIEIEATIYPRFIREVILALGELYGYGWVGQYRLSPQGLEYVESREYVEGDPINKIDFNATARTGNLHLKYFLDEGGLGNAVVFDVRAPGRYTADYLASKFLATLLSSEMPTVVVTDGVKTYRYEGTREYVLKVALYWVFKIALDKGERIYELVPPKVRSELEKILRIDRGVGEFVDPYNLTQGAKDVVIIAHPLYDTARLLKFLAKAKASGVRVKVIYPESPWLDSEDLESAYIEYKSFRNVVKAIDSLVGEGS